MRSSLLRVLGFLVAACCATAVPVGAQQTGSVTGLVTREDDGSPLSGVAVSVRSTSLATITGTDGRFTLERVPVGQQVLVFRQLGQQPAEQAVTVAAGASVIVEVALAVRPVTLSELVVTGASRVPERVVEAPSAVSVVDPVVARDMSVTGQAPLALVNVPGVDVVQSGMTDFNVNARGFNSSLNRRVLTLQDGRDLSIAFLGAQEWGAMAIPLEDVDRIELVRGPGSALYGANAFSGVLNILTPPARDVRGTKATVAAGELSTLRGDLRHAGVLGQGRFGYRVNVGYGRSETWTEPRTLRDSTAMRTEYAEATDSTVPKLIELRGLNYQTTNPTTGAPTGDPADLVAIYGSGRFDYYAPDGSVVTLDGGSAWGLHETAVTGLGRVQVSRSVRPWVRAAWAANNYNLMAWYSGRDTPRPQYALNSGAELLEHSSLMHAEGQYNRSLLADQFRVVLGASFRVYRLDTEGSLMAPADDDRSDNYYAGYGQLEYKPVPQVRLVAAARYDQGDLIDGQFSPKGAIVVSPADDHSFRFTFNRAFQTPNYSEFFLRAPAGPATGAPRQLEAGLEQYFASVKAALGPAVADLNLPDDLPWNFSPQTQPLALGNAALDVETANSFEIGYKGNVTPRVFVTVDAFLSELENFVTDLLPGVNPAYPVYLLTDGGTNVPGNLVALGDRIDQLEAGGFITPQQAAALRAPIPTLQAGYGALNAQLVQTGLLATLPGDQRAIVVSYTNAGRVTERGIEVGFGALLTDEFRVEASYTFFDFEVKEQQLGDALVPNTPRHKGTIGLSYRGRRGFDAHVNARLQEGFDWAAGIFKGYVPASQTINATAGYAVNNNLRVFATGTNLLDQQRFHQFGGSVVGRRMLGGVTATF